MCSWQYLIQTCWWPLNDHCSVHLISPHLPGFMWHGGLKAHWSYLRYDEWRVALMFSLICAWTNGCANTRDDVDLGRHRSHYNVTVTIQYSTNPKQPILLKPWTRLLGKWLASCVSALAQRTLIDSILNAINTMHDAFKLQIAFTEIKHPSITTYYNMLRYIETQLENCKTEVTAYPWIRIYAQRYYLTFSLLSPPHNVETIPGSILPEY